MWAWRYSEKADRTYSSGMSGRSSGFTPPKAEFRRLMSKLQHLPRAFETGCGPPRLKGIAWRKIRLFADSAPAYTTKTAQRLLAEFRFLADWPPYSPNLNLLDFDTRHTLQAKAQAKPDSNLTAYVCPSPRNRSRKRRYISAKHRFSPANVSTPTSFKSFWDSIWSPGSRGT